MFSNRIADTWENNGALSFSMLFPRRAPASGKQRLEFFRRTAGFLHPLLSSVLSHSRRFRFPYFLSLQDKQNAACDDGQYSGGSGSQKPAAGELHRRTIAGIGPI